LDTTGFTNNIANAVSLITRRRLNLRTEGMAEEGRKEFHEGLALATKTFKDAYDENDLYAMLLCENTFLAKDLEGAEPDEQDAIKSYEKALVEYDDAFNCLDLIAKPEEYKQAAAIVSHAPKFRYRAMPKDGFIVAMAAQPARIKNGMTAVGTDPDERSLRKDRIKASRKALNLYFKKQMAILGKEQEESQ
jgi:hypothetical protein